MCRYINLHDIHLKKSELSLYKKTFYEKHYMKKTYWTLMAFGNFRFIMPLKIRKTQVSIQNLNKMILKLIFNKKLHAFRYIVNWRCTYDFYFHMI